MATELLVAYDIPSDRRRRKVADALERLGRRVQYSVFVLRGRSAVQAERAIEPLIDPAEDDVRIHVLCAACAERTRLLGLARRTRGPAGFRIF
ncbi:MAG: CRISPR-associated endonuclease Cas2 [Myxococcota bacterium]